MSETNDPIAAPELDGATDRSELRGDMTRALAKGGMSDFHVISWETARTVLTPKRRELIETLRSKDVESVRGLAREVGRDKAQVSRDLGDLAEYGIITYEESGRSKQPQLTQEHIIVEPIV